MLQIESITIMSRIYRLKSKDATPPAVRDRQTLTLVYKNNLFKDLPRFVTVKQIHLTMEDDSAHNYVQFVGFNRRMLREDFDMCLAERVFEPTQGTIRCLNEPKNLLNPAA